MAMRRTAHRSVSIPTVRAMVWQRRQVEGGGAVEDCAGGHGPYTRHAGVLVARAMSWLRCGLMRAERQNAIDRPAVALDHRPGSWTFDDKVTQVFDDMLRRSIPQLETMRSLVFEVGKQFVRPGTWVVDLGCSLGDGMAPFVSAFGEHVGFVGVETSSAMLDSVRARFRDDIEQGTVQVLDLDLRKGYPEMETSLTLSVLTLQFIPVEHRLRVVQDAYDRTRPGGALVLVEKVLGSSGSANALLTELYEDLKRQNGYTQEDIDRKRLSLEGVLVPLTAAWNEDLLRRAGFAVVECFWRSLNFAGWVAVKKEPVALS
jgi:tRNA (cmo5U34)-methyltransferase